MFLNSLFRLIDVLDGSRSKYRKRNKSRRLLRKHGANIKVGIYHGGDFFRVARDQHINGTPTKSVSEADSLIQIMKHRLLAFSCARTSFGVAIATIAALASTPSTVASVSFSAGTNIAIQVYGTPSGILTADFNQDGKMDLAVASSSVITLISGIGNGTFNAPTNFSASAQTYLAAGDLNNDGKLDVIAINNYGGTVLLGDGHGHFPMQTNLDAFIVNYPSGMAIGDFNTDGHLDLSITSSSGVKVAFGRGDGSFAIPTNYPTPIQYAYITDIQAGNIYGNGRIDLVVSVYNSQKGSNIFCVLLNRWDGTFAPPKLFFSTKTLERHQCLRLADFNADEKPDAAVLNYNGKSMEIWLNHGSGVFTPANNYTLGFSPTSMASGDFNGDGTIDLVIRGDTTAMVLLGNGDGTFKTDQQIIVPADSGTSEAIAVGDFNGDGMPDLAFLKPSLINESSNSVVVMFNQTPPALQIASMAGYNQLTWLNTFGDGFKLEYTTSLATPVSWQPFPYPPVLIGKEKAVTDWMDRGQKFYRLRK